MTAETASPPVNFETWEALILSGQMDHANIEKLMNDQPIFAEWYKRRADNRAKRRA